MIHRNQADRLRKLIREALLAAKNDGQSGIAVWVDCPYRAQRKLAEATLSNYINHLTTASGRRKSTGQRPKSANRPVACQTQAEKATSNGLI